jgi:TPR repeat protein
MTRSLTSALLAITLTLGCGGAAVAQAPNRTKAEVLKSSMAAYAAYERQDYATALPIFRELAGQGYAHAQSNLGLMYIAGHGVAQDYKEAARLFGLASAQGYAEAQANLGVMYRDGTGVAQDYKEAVRLYRLAATQGNANAQFNLGYMYDEGKGVAQDYLRAHMWYNLGGISGDSKKVSHNRDLVAAKMTPAQIAEAQAMARKCQASNFKQCD